MEMTWFGFDGKIYDFKIHKTHPKIFEIQTTLKER